jgi:hypothetical protein
MTAATTGKCSSRTEAHDARPGSLGSSWRMITGRQAFRVAVNRRAPKRTDRVLRHLGPDSEERTRAVDDVLGSRGTAVDRTRTVSGSEPRNRRS